MGASKVSAFPKEALPWLIARPPCWRRGLWLEFFQVPFSGRKSRLQVSVRAPASLLTLMSDSTRDSIILKETNFLFLAL